MRDKDVNKMMKNFKTKMNQRYMIPPTLVEKYKDYLCFMIEIDFTYMEVVVPCVKFIETMGYEMSINLIEVYAQIILHSEVDFGCPRWGTYAEKIKEVQSKLMEKDTKKKVEKVIDYILKESRM